jgi:DNA-binding transcriptional LysR family regulator
MTTVGLRVQGLPLNDRTLVLAHVATLRSEDQRFAAQDVDGLYREVAVPGPAKISNVLASLERNQLLIRMTGRGRVWRITPKGIARVQALVSDMDLAVLLSEAKAHGTQLGGQAHSVVPPTLSPPGLTPAIRTFLEEFPFETNVFGMTRFASEDPELDDPAASAVEVARDVCTAHGLTFHLASDRALVDDLWGNVAAHMWSCHYGIAFFEDRVGRGLNYNLSIEVGAMLMAGRRCALLRDASIASMPTDLVGHIYRGLDLGVPSQVRTNVHQWIASDLGFGTCGTCTS